MNVNNARPLLAFWLLALAAALIAVAGMRAGAASQVRTETPTHHATSVAEPGPTASRVPARG